MFKLSSAFQRKKYHLLVTSGQVLETKIHEVGVKSRLKFLCRIGSGFVFWTTMYLWLRVQNDGSTRKYSTKKGKYLWKDPRWHMISWAHSRPTVKVLSCRLCSSSQSCVLIWLIPIEHEMILRYQERACGIVKQADHLLQAVTCFPPSLTCCQLLKLCQATPKI